MAIWKSGTLGNRDGKLVKRVSSYDAGNIEEDEGDSTDMPGGGTTTGDSGCVHNVVNQAPVP